MGKIGNNPAWEFIPDAHGNPVFVGYKDDDAGQYALIDRLVKKYKNMKIIIIYPDDAKQPAIVDGVMRIDLIKRYIAKKGYGRRVETRVLNKTKNRIDMVRSGVELLAKSNFDVEACLTGMEKLAGVRMKKDKASGFISPKDFDKNDKQHAGDAFCYVAAAIQTGYTHDCASNAYFPQARGADSQMTRKLSY